MNRLVKVIIISISIALLAAYPVYYFYREHKVDGLFLELTKEMSKADVLSELGPPDSTEQCGKWLWWGGDGNYLGENKGKCVEWIRYNFFLHAYGIGFNEEGNVVSKYQYFSE